jgi:four helix bundle protein
MARIEKFEDIEAWRASRELSRLIYEASRREPFCRDFALTNQIRGASISVLSNIWEGFEPGGNKEFLQFLAVAKGSCGEVRAQLHAALDQNYIESEMFRKISDKASETSRLIAGFIKYLQQSELRGHRFQ